MSSAPPTTGAPAGALGAQPVTSTWAPLRVRMFRAVWLAQLGSNVGTWMQTVGAQWLLVHDPHASALVALVQTASSLPFLLVGLPAGVLADVFDRRRYLLAVQTLLVATAAAMALLTATGSLPPALLLTLTFVLGTGAALSLPAWQAVIPSLVPRQQLPSASALGGISQNLARAVGPALAGVLVARIGVAAVFAVNAASFIGGIVVMAAWREPPADASEYGRERMVAALRAGTRYAVYSPIVRRLLLRLVVFVAPATALWALLPIVASHRLGLGSGGYGLLLGALGVGAVGAALCLPLVRRALSPRSLALVCALLYAGSLAACALADPAPLVALALVPAGSAWLAVLVSLNATMQLVLPGWVRARGLSIYQLTFMGSQAIAAFGWGLVAQHLGLRVALLAAAVTLLAGALAGVRWPLHDVSGLDRTPVAYWRTPDLVLAPEPLVGPVLITLVWRVREQNRDAFVEAMQVVGRSRRRTGATSWDLFRDGEHPERFLELYVVGSWDEHLRQHHERLTGADQAFEARAYELAEGPPEVAHLFPADTPLPDGAGEELGR